MPTPEPGQRSKGRQGQPRASAPVTSATDTGGGATGVESLKEITDLFKNLSQETTTLLRQEIQLAKAELTDKGKQAGLGAGLFGAAGVVGLLTAGAFTSFLILVLALFMAPWVAALIVTVVYAAVAGGLALGGKKKVEQASPLVPEQALDQAKETKERVQSAWQSSAR